MMTIMQFAILVLATRGAVDVWMQGSIFAWARARVEAWSLEDGETARSRIKLFLSELSRCHYCFTYQVAIWFTLIVLCFPRIDEWCLAGSWAARLAWPPLALGYLLVHGLAVAGAAWLAELSFRQLASWASQSRGHT